MAEDTWRVEDLIYLLVDSGLASPSGVLPIWDHRAPMPSVGPCPKKRHVTRTLAGSLEFRASAAHERCPEHLYLESGLHFCSSFFVPSTPSPSAAASVDNNGKLAASDLTPQESSRPLRYVVRRIASRFRPHVLKQFRRQCTILLVGLCVGDGFGLEP